MLQVEYDMLKRINKCPLSVQMESNKLFMHVSKHEEDLSAINKMLDEVSENSSEFAMAQHFIKSKKTQHLLSAFVDGISSLSVKEFNDKEFNGNKFWGPIVKKRREPKMKKCQQRKFKKETLKPIISAVKDMIYYDFSGQKYLEEHHQTQIHIAHFGPNSQYNTDIKIIEAETDVSSMYAEPSISVPTVRESQPKVEATYQELCSQVDRLQDDIRILNEKHDAQIDVIETSRLNLLLDVDRLEDDNFNHQQYITKLKEELNILARRIKLLDKHNCSKTKRITKLTDTIDEQRRKYAKYQEDISDENACPICYEMVR